MNAGFWMGLIRPMVHTLNKTNCVHKTLVKSLIVMLMLINYIYLQRYVIIVFYSTCQQKLPPVAVPRTISRRGRITLVPANNAKVIARYYISSRNGITQNKQVLTCRGNASILENWRNYSTHDLPRHRGAIPFH